MSESNDQIPTITRDPDKDKRPEFRVIVSRDPINFGSQVADLLNERFESTRNVLVVDGCMYGEYVRYPEFDDVDHAGFSIHQVRGDRDEYEKRRNARLIKEITELWESPDLIALVKRVALDLKHIHETGDVFRPAPDPASSAEVEPVKE